MKKINIVVSARSFFLPEQSLLEDNRFLWSYEITVENQSDVMVQLLNRYWRINDAAGRVEEVNGPGVVGLQPLIKGGKQFSYTSFCQLKTPQGAMEGHYEMQTLDEIRFLVQIPKFSLLSPVIISAGHSSLLH
jgi:ApaG protein